MSYKNNKLLSSEDYITEKLKRIYKLLELDQLNKGWILKSIYWSRTSAMAE